MALDLAALKAKIAAQKAAATPPAQVQNETPKTSIAATTATLKPTIQQQQPQAVASTEQAPTVNPPATLGTSKTTEIDHLDFIAKMNSLSEAIHRQHPTMPVLLMQIHKQLRADPELVTTLDEDAIGIVVKGLQIQTKTELVTAATKPTRAKKNAALSVDML